MSDPAFSERVAQVRARVARAAERAGRAPESVRIVAASKTQPVERLLEALELGLLDLGESRVQEAEAKIAELEAIRPNRAIWHLIGHLQSNKAGRAAALFDWVHSVDSVRIAEALDRHAAERGRTLQVVVEVNTSAEAAKAGVPPAQAMALLGEVARRPRLVPRGFMTVGPLVPEPEDARPAFRALRACLEEARRTCPELGLDTLSMGMSGDFEVAIEEGATCVRVGTALFGQRP